MIFNFWEEVRVPKHDPDHFNITHLRCSVGVGRYWAELGTLWRISSVGHVPREDFSWLVSDIGESTIKSKRSQQKIGKHKDCSFITGKIRSHGVHLLTWPAHGIQLQCFLMWMRVEPVRYDDSNSPYHVHQNMLNRPLYYANSEGCP